MKHTPGPWRADFGEAIRIKDAQGNTICIVTHLTKAGRRKANEVEANAYLIAKAPELYKALTKLVECIEGIKHDRQDEGTEPDWFDWVFINQELKRSKEALGGGE